jgi:hypothetical protein
LGGICGGVPCWLALAQTSPCSYQSCLAARISVADSTASPGYAAVRCGLRADGVGPGRVVEPAPRRRAANSLESVVDSPRQSPTMTTRCPRHVPAEPTRQRNRPDMSMLCDGLAVCAGVRGHGMLVGGSTGHARTPCTVPARRGCAVTRGASSHTTRGGCHCRSRDFCSRADAPSVERYLTSPQIQRVRTVECLFMRR